MPTYVYAILRPDGSDGETFEIVQKMTDPPLTSHPQSGAPVRRVIQPPIIPGAGSDHATRQMLSDKNLDRLGFTKYQRSGGGAYEKKAGQGPSTISAD
jgi:predicted nucleic acid-binding Zn ribbon protein